MSDGRVRIQKALADAGVASRRRAEEMVRAGRVSVNGVVATIGQPVMPASDRIVVDGREITRDAARVYLALAKPAGVTSTVSDRHATRTVLDLVPRELRHGATRLYPVGRLDRDSEGLLLLTNDGAWAQRMLHPSHGVEREYAVGIDQPLSATQARELAAGIQLDEGRATIARLSGASSASIRQLDRLIGADARRLVWYHVTLEQGMKRQLRRMFAAVRSPVRRLVRLRFGTLRLAGMNLGDVRALSAAERERLAALADRKPDARRRGLVVSIDGPGSSGKSTVGAHAAEKLGYRFIDTGVLYRGLTWLALHRGVDPDDGDGLARLAPEMELAPDEHQRYVHLIVDGSEITDELHKPEVDREVSRVSRHAQVRAQLLPVQRALASGGSIIMAGRDIGSVVLPDADPKIYLEVSIDERARRRARERGVEDNLQALAEIKDELRQRDGIDSTRTTAPLRRPEGALVINTEGNTLQQTVDQVVGVIREHERRQGR